MTGTVTPQEIRLPSRPREAHKGDFGRVCILGGSVGYTGAPVLAAKAAVRTGAGLVTVLVPEAIYPIVAVKLESAMPRPLPAEEMSGALSALACREALRQIDDADAALIGPGLSRKEGAAETARSILTRTKAPLVVDADGINALEGHMNRLDSRRGLVTVLTPHDGEFSRLTGTLPPRDLEGRVAAAKSFAAAHSCILVLKGHRTVTAFPDGELYVNATGNPGMAKGGSGDVLGGMLVSLMAQRIPIKQAVPWAVCLHGQAGDLAAEERGEYGMTPGDMIEMIPLTLKRF